MKIRLRPANFEDCQLLWEWANEPKLRSLSFCTQPILWTNHVDWFHAKLMDPRCLFLMVEDETGVAIGQIRFDMTEQRAIVSLGIDIRQRGKGYGSIIVRQASQFLFAQSDIEAIHAYIKPTNGASHRIFVKAGYDEMGLTSVKGHEALHFVLPCNQHS